MMVREPSPQKKQVNSSDGDGLDLMLLDTYENVTVSEKEMGKSPKIVEDDFMSDLYSGKI